MNGIEEQLKKLIVMLKQELPGLDTNNLVELLKEIVIVKIS